MMRIDQILEVLKVKSDTALQRIEELHLKKQHVQLFLNEQVKQARHSEFPDLSLGGLVDLTALFYQEYNTMISAYHNIWARDFMITALKGGLSITKAFTASPDLTNNAIENCNQVRQVVDVALNELRVRVNIFFQTLENDGSRTIVEKMISGLKKNALHLVCKKGDIDSFKVLLKNQLDPVILKALRAVDASGKTPMTYIREISDIEIRKQMFHLIASQLFSYTRVASQLHKLRTTSFGCSGNSLQSNKVTQDDNQYKHQQRIVR